jgi:hypothetical protein
MCHATILVQPTGWNSLIRIGVAHVLHVRALECGYTDSNLLIFIRFSARKFNVDRAIGRDVDEASGRVD